jgi:hypothetical protein
MSKRITLSELEAFIKGSLTTKIRKDVSTIHMIREADVASCVYYHLRRFLHLDKTWRVFTQRHSKETGYIIDMVVLKGDLKQEGKLLSPRIAMEFKWNQNRMGKKDRDSLGACVKDLKVKKAYYISVLDKRGKHTITKKPYEKYKVFEMYVRPKVKPKDLKAWRKSRQLFKNAFGE